MDLQKSSSDFKNSWVNRHPFMILFLVIAIVSAISTLSVSKSVSVTPPEPQLTPEEQRAQVQREKEALVAYMKSPAGKICQEHPTWKREDCEELVKGNVWIGMPYEMLVYKIGKPNSINPSNYGNGNRYQYCWDNRNPGCFYDNNEDGLIDSWN